MKSLSACGRGVIRGTRNFHDLQNIPQRKAEPERLALRHNASCRTRPSTWPRAWAAVLEEIVSGAVGGSEARSAFKSTISPRGAISVSRLVESIDTSEFTFVAFPDGWSTPYRRRVWTERTIAPPVALVTRTARSVAGQGNVTLPSQQ